MKAHFTFDGHSLAHWPRMHNFFFFFFGGGGDMGGEGGGDMGGEGIVAMLGVCGSMLNGKHAPQLTRPSDSAFVIKVL